MCEDLLPANMRNATVTRHFSGKGMRRIAEPPGMYADVTRFPSKPPAPMTFARVDGQSTQRSSHISHRLYSHFRFGVAKRIY